jgi:hypothetical protein
VSERDIIHDYLVSLSKYLARLNKREADEVIMEIESHILDVLEAREEGSKVTVESVLAGFGNPRELAAQYVEHILQGTPPPKGFKTIQTVKKGVTKGLYFVVTGVGYVISLMLIFVGVWELLEPDKVGIWSTSHGQSVILGIAYDPPVDGQRELFGWWLMPFGIGAGLVGLYLTYRVQSALRSMLR